MDFMTFPDGPLRLKDITVPACFLDDVQMAGRPSGDALIRTDLSIADGMLVETGGTEIDMQGAMVFPCFTDMHTHLDKGHTWARAPNPDGTFDGAIATVGADRIANWSAEDVRARMSFSLRCAYAHGTRAIRTHLDSIPPQDDISWAVFQELRADWADRIALQAVCLVGCDRVPSDDFDHTADLVAAAHGVLGMVTYPVPDLAERLRSFFAIATDRNMAVDFHVDEILDPSVETLRLIAETIIDLEFDAPVTVGHCCSLTTQDEARAMDTLDLVAQAGINVVSLPMCNLYLQDRHAGRTPRHRGITLVHEMRARDIPVAFASDNTRDPFYAYGDMDMLEVMREATRIGHLDHSRDDWPSAFVCAPTDICSFDVQDLRPGHPADLVICKARSWTELFARPQSDRIVLRHGRQIDRTLPDYAELDPLMETS